jgi:hypothetical protein
MVYFWSFLPNFTHLLVALSQKKTTLSRVVFLLARGSGRRKPVQAASEFPISTLSVQLAALALRGLGSESLCPSQEKSHSRKRMAFFSEIRSLRNE